MRIKSIELCGFKSFPEKTVLDMSGPTTAIVGPNGCGKSNVVDAVKWVIGETSMKELRGSLMEDVIFAGSEAKAPLNMAEVSLTLSNNDGKVPGMYGDSSEITLKRRYFRDGESEYFINNTRCRLKDMAEVFVDSGVGSETYSIIEQGTVSQLVSSKPEEKRLIIEEAAGITKYKNRKNSALRKMEATRQNLLRVNDILSELKRQTLSITRQANKAEKYKKLKDELDALDLALQAKSFSDIENEILKTKESHSPLTDELTEGQALVSRLESELESLKLGIVDEETELESMNQRIFQKSSDIQKAESDIELIKNETESINNTKISKGAEIESVTHRIEQVENDIRAKDAEKEEILKSIEHLKEKIEILGTRIDSEKRNLAERTNKEEELKSRIFGAVSKITESKNNLVNLEKSKREIHLRIERFTKEKSELESETKQIEFNFDGLDSKKNETINLKKDLEQRLANKTEEVERTKKNIEEEQNKLRTNLLVLEKTKSRLNSLVEYEDQMKDFETPMKELLETTGSAESFGRVSLIADVLNVKQGFELAAQAALGSKFRGVVVDSNNTKFDVIKHIKNNKLLRNVVLDKLPRDLGDVIDIPSGTNGFLGILSDLVEPVSGYNEVSKLLLGNYLVFENLETAREFWQAAHPKYTLVTLDGDLLESSGIIEAGKFAGLGGGIFERRSEIQEKRALIDGLESENTELESKISASKDRCTILEKEAALLKEDAYSFDLKIVEVEKDISRISSSLDENKKRLSILTGEIEENGSRLGDIERDEYQNSRSIEESEISKEELTKELEMLKGGFESAERGIEEKQRDLMVLNGELSTLKERADSISKNAENLNSLIDTYRGDVAQKQDEISRASDKMLQLESEKQEKEKLVQNGMNELNALKENIELRRVEFSKRKNRILDLDSTLRDGKTKVEDLQQTITNLNLKFSELNVKRDMVKEQIKNSFGIDVEAEMEKLKEKIPTDENIEEVRIKRLEMKGKVDSLGDVNIGAIEELKEIEERQKFLFEQKEDLENSLVDLDKMIKRINQTTKKRFREAFDAVNEKFKEVFPKLFEGGKAYLTLIDEENLLESGVDIIAQPPGKTMQNINLRSGGEKTLTAIALIISVFLHRPAPFCFLDEVDAPLDDANILRFIKIIKDLSTTSQFILITHNKVTMEVAETLYGITMEDQGISKVVSVRFSDKHERRRLEDTIAA